MPPNPRDGHRLRSGLVPLSGVAIVIADSLASEFHGRPDIRDRLAALATERLAFFELLAADVDLRCDGGVHSSPHRGCILR